ncbi:MAG: hypothetical protein AAGK21_03940 [Bacteroidota bacterium]
MHFRPDVLDAVKVVEQLDVTDACRESLGGPHAAAAAAAVVDCQGLDRLAEAVDRLTEAVTRDD